MLTLFCYKLLTARSYKTRLIKRTYIITIGYLTLKDLKNILNNTKNPFLTLRRDLLGPMFSGIVNPPDDSDEDNKDKDLPDTEDGKYNTGEIPAVKYIMLEEKDNNTNTLTPKYYGILCLARNKKDPRKWRWIGTFRPDSKLQGDKNEICRQLIKEFNEYSRGVKKQVPLSSYFTSENIMFSLRIIQFAYLCYLNYKLNKKLENKDQP